MIADKMPRRPRPAVKVNTTRLVGEHFTAAGKPKKGFVTKDSACKWMLARNLYLNVYHCSVCNRWHLSSR